MDGDNEAAAEDIPSAAASSIYHLPTAINPICKSKHPQSDFYRYTRRDVVHAEAAEVMNRFSATSAALRETSPLQFWHQPLSGLSPPRPARRCRLARVWSITRRVRSMTERVWLSSAFTS